MVQKKIIKTKCFFLEKVEGNRKVVKFGSEKEKQTNQRKTETVNMLKLFDRNMRTLKFGVKNLKTETLMETTLKDRKIRR